MKFAPLDIPLERRLQTIALVYFLHHPFVLLFAGVVLSIYMVLFTNLYALPLAYVVWYFYDMNKDERGGRRWLWIRKWRFLKFVRDYFPVVLVKTADIPANRNYIFASHPHGIISASNLINFLSDVTGFSEKFPGITPYTLTLRMNFFLPFYRDLFLVCGLCSASKKSIKWILTKMGVGNAVVLVVGGAQEVLDAHKDHDYKLTLKNRKGFVSQALQHGADLVPVFCFGENDLYRQLDNPPGSWRRSFQEKVKQIVGFSVPFVCGRGIFQYSYGHLPFRKQLTCVVGAPICVEKVSNPTQQQIDELHARYIKQLTDLYEKHKDSCGDSHRKLIIA